MRHLWTLCLSLAASLPVEQAAAADRLILRNLDILTGQTVAHFDEDGVELDQPGTETVTRLGWDEIERGRVALNQARFDALLEELGLPLFRLRQRMKSSDYRAAGLVAEKLYPRYAERRSQTAYLVCQATMWSRLASGRREAAVEPFLRSYELLRSRAAVSSRLPGRRRPLVDEPTALTSELVPVWLDAAAAKASLASVEAAIRAMANPRPPGVYLYYATLAVAAGEPAEGERMLPLLEANSSPFAGMAGLVRIQQEPAGEIASGTIDRLREQLPELPSSCRLAALYYVGLADARADSDQRCREGLLSLLTLPAAYGDTQPELAAAALYQAAAGLDKLKDGAGAAAVRAELTAQYAGTRQERLSRSQAGR